VRHGGHERGVAARVGELRDPRIGAQHGARAVDVADRAGVFELAELRLAHPCARRVVSVMGIPRRAGSWTKRSPAIAFSSGTAPRGAAPEVACASTIDAGYAVVRSIALKPVASSWKSMIS